MDFDKIKQGVVWRTFATVALYAICSILYTVLTIAANVEISNAAVGQLENSDAAYAKFALMNHYLSGQALASAIFLFGTLAIW
jgi:hypothetical protein